MARKIVYTAFRRRPGGSCGHHHQTKEAAQKCARRYGKGWYVGSYQVSH